MTGPVSSPRWRSVLSLALVGMLASACEARVAGPQAGSPLPPPPPPPPSSFAIQPAMTSVPPSGTVTFAVSGGTPATAVDWSASAGSITSDGIYTAPGQLGSYRVQARYDGDTGAAIVNVVPPGAPGALYAAASSTCAGMPIRTTGTTTYFCDCAAGRQDGCVPGSDGNAGTISAPKQSWAQVVARFNSMNGGDTVALCKGGAWSVGGVAVFNNPRCSPAADMRTADNTTTCDLRDYAPDWGGTAKPIVRETSSANLLQFWLNRQSGIRVLNLDLEGGGTGPGGSDLGVRAIALGNNGTGTNDDFLICNNTINGWNHGIHINGGTCSRDDIWGNRITNISTEGILGPSMGGKIDANFFDNAGAYAVMSHAIYVSAYPVQLTNFSVVNNEIRRSSGGMCNGVILVVHGQVDGLNIENNLIDGGPAPGGSCWGIGVDAGGYPTACWFRNLTIRRNLIMNVGWAPISVASAPSPIIENNVIVSGMRGGGIGIHVPGIRSRSSPADATTTAAVVRNNTLYFPASATGSIAIQVGDIAEGSGYVVANNAVSFAASAGTCLDLRLPASSYDYVDHDLCNGFQRWEYTRGSLAAWQTYSGGRFDMSSLSAAPQFTSVPDDLTPAAGSPLIGHGDLSQAPTYDFNLQTRPDPPSIGAIEP